MKGNKYKLNVAIKVISFRNETKTFVFPEQELETIDQETLRYQEEEDFFIAKKNKILSTIQKEYQKNNDFPPQDIELNEQGFFLKNDKEYYIRPLFQNITFKNQKYSLKDIVIDNMRKGMLHVWYKVDQRRAEEEPNFLSFFKYKPSDLLERIELKTITKKDLDYLWEQLNGIKKYSSIIRFLLQKQNVSFEELYTIFCTTVKNDKDPERVAPTKSTVSLRLPYWDN